MQTALSLDINEISQLARNSFAGSFMDDAAKQTALDRFERFADAFTAS